MPGEPRSNVTSRGLDILQIFDAADQYGNTLDYTTLLPLLCGGGRFTFETAASGAKRLKLVDDTKGIMGGWVIWPGKSPRVVAQIAQVFPAQVTTTSPLKVTPLKNTSLDIDDTLDEQAVTALDPDYTPAEGDNGYVVAATRLDGQDLLFCPCGGGGGGGGGASGWYGDGSDGAVHFTAADSGYWFAGSYLTDDSTDECLSYNVPDATWIHFLQRDICCTTLEIDADVIVCPMGCAICVNAGADGLLLHGSIDNGGDLGAFIYTKVIPGGLNTDSKGSFFIGTGDQAGNAISGIWQQSNAGVPGPAGGNGAVGSGAPDVGPPFNEQPDTDLGGDKHAGSGGDAGAFTGGDGGYAGRGTTGTTNSVPDAQARGATGMGARSSVFSLATGQALITATGGNTIHGGASGGSGACDAGGGSGSAGRGGFGGAATRVRTKTWDADSDGEIRSNGGRGFDADTSVVAAGGGGGGNPGWIGIVSDEAVPGGVTLSTAPGAGGNGANGGANGTAGKADGFTGVAAP